MAERRCEAKAMCQRVRMPLPRCIWCKTEMLPLFLVYLLGRFIALFFVFYIHRKHTVLIERLSKRTRKTEMVR